MKIRNLMIAAPLVLTATTSLWAQSEGQVGKREMTNPVTQPGTDNAVTPQAATKVADQDALKLAQSDYAVINFSAGSSQLQDEQKVALKQALQGRPEKESIKVAVWSDKSWSPEGQEDKFAKDDKKLAEQRGKAIEEYLSKTFPKKDVEVYTMTEKVGFFAKLFNTEEAEIKSVFAKKGDESELKSSSRAAQVLRDHGGPSKAVVLVKQD